LVSYRNQPVPKKRLLVGKDFVIFFLADDVRVLWLVVSDLSESLLNSSLLCGG